MPCKLGVQAIGLIRFSALGNDKRSVCRDLCLVCVCSVRSIRFMGLGQRFVLRVLVRVESDWSNPASVQSVPRPGSDPARTSSVISRVLWCWVLVVEIHVVIMMKI